VEKYVLGGGRHGGELHAGKGHERRQARPHHCLQLISRQGIVQGVHIAQSVWHHAPFLPHIRELSAYPLGIIPQIAMPNISHVEHLDAQLRRSTWTWSEQTPISLLDHCF
jgi:hypothetical protein